MGRWKHMGDKDMWRGASSVPQEQSSHFMILYPSLRCRARQDQRQRRSDCAASTGKHWEADMMHQDLNLEDVIDLCVYMTTGRISGSGSSAS